jgi:hypothetical protein
MLLTILTMQPRRFHSRIEGWIFYLSLILGNIFLCKSFAEAEFQMAAARLNGHTYLCHSQMLRLSTTFNISSQLRTCHIPISQSHIDEYFVVILHASLLNKIFTFSISAFVLWILLWLILRRSQI